MNINEFQKLRYKIALMIGWAAMPVLIAYLWGRQLFLDIHGVNSMADLLFLPLTAFCLIAIVIGLLQLLFYRLKKGVGFCLYWLAMLFLIWGPVYFLSDMVLLGLKWRVKLEAKFVQCQEEAVQVGLLGFYNVCESQDMGRGAFLTLFRDIVYDSSDALILKSDRRPKTFHAFMDAEGTSNVHVQKITDHYYVVHSN